jgi:hypothetical protein
MVITTNKSNWSGQNGTITFRDNVHFTLSDIDGEFTIREDYIDGEIQYVVTDPEGWHYYGHILNNTVLFEYNGIYRTNKDAAVAFAKLAWNIF